MVISPDEALATVMRLSDEIPSLTVAGVAGPGDPLANPEETFKTLRLIGEKDPSMNLCLATNGLALMENMDKIIETGIGFVTVTVNAIEPEIGAKMVQWVVVEGKRYVGKEAASILWEHQKEGIEALVKNGIKVKINTVLCPGINDEHIPEVAKEVGALGATLMNITRLIPVKGTIFEGITPPSQKDVEELRKVCSVHIPQMGHCRQCRADAVGLLDYPISHIPFRDPGLSCETPRPKCENALNGSIG